jgi:hypothetical protein
MIVPSQSQRCKGGIIGIILSEEKINLYKKQRTPSRRDIIDHKNKKGSNRNIHPSSRKGSARKIERNSSKRSLKRKGSNSYLEKYNSRNSRDRKRSSSSKRQNSYDSNISFNRKNGNKSRSIGQSSKKSTSRSKNQQKKLKPVRPPSRRKSIDKGSSSKYGALPRRQSRERVLSSYNSAKGGRAQNHRIPTRQEK